jgi:hypothetical protein
MSDLIILIYNWQTHRVIYISNQEGLKNTYHKLITGPINVLQVTKIQ